VQTEMMKRLLVKDANSPSGYKIIGYSHNRIESDGATIMTEWFRSVSEPSWESYNGDCMIDYEAFDLGVKVGNDWFFEGDLFKDAFRGTIWRLVYEGVDGWRVHEYSDEKITRPGFSHEHIGNIHEQPVIHESRNIQNGDET